MRFTNVKALLSQSLTGTFPMKTMIVEKTVIVKLGESGPCYIKLVVKV